jgi:Tfp pilus assembly protein PilN
MFMEVKRPANGATRRGDKIAGDHYWLWFYFGQPLRIVANKLLPHVIPTIARRRERASILTRWPAKLAQRLHEKMRIKKRAVSAETPRAPAQFRLTVGG